MQSNEQSVLTSNLDDQQISSLGLRACTAGGRLRCKLSSRGILALHFGHLSVSAWSLRRLAGWRSCTQSRFGDLHPIGIPLTPHSMACGMQVVTYDASPAAGAAPACIQNTWTFFQSVMASREDEAWRAVVSNAFGTCQPLRSSAEVEDLAYWVQVRRAAQRLLCWRGMQPVLLLKYCHGSACNLSAARVKVHTLSSSLRECLEVGSALGVLHCPVLEVHAA